MLVLPGVGREHVGSLAAQGLAELPQLAQSLRTQPKQTTAVLSRLLGSDTAARNCAQVRPVPRFTYYSWLGNKKQVWMLLPRPEQIEMVGCRCADGCRQSN